MKVSELLKPSLIAQLEGKVLTASKELQKEQLQKKEVVQDNSSKNTIDILV